MGWIVGDEGVNCSDAGRPAYSSGGIGEGTLSGLAGRKGIGCSRGTVGFADPRGLNSGGAGTCMVQRMYR